MRGRLLSVLGVGLGLAFVAASCWMNLIFIVGQRSGLSSQDASSST
jgi:hypothetical protein